MSGKIGKLEQMAMKIAASVDPSSDRERIQDIEARRLLSNLDHAKIKDDVCEETLAKLEPILYPSSWLYCDKTAMLAMQFVHDKYKKWAREGYRVVIEGGKERERRRVMNYCIYRAILANFDCCTFVARTYDWPQAMAVFSSFSDPRRDGIIGGMEKIPVLGLTELDLSNHPRPNSDTDVILTGMLRYRMLEDMPTVITLRNSSLSDQKSTLGTEVCNIITTRHDETEDKVLRIRIAGGEIE